jgi:AraC-like DNA-binding protein
MDDINMSSNLQAKRWLTAKTLHQIQILSCDICSFVAWDCPDHCAPFWRLYLHDKSGAEIVLGGRTVPIRPDCLVLIPPNTHFSSRLQKPVQQMFLHFLVEPRFKGRTNAVFQFHASAGQSKLCDGIARMLTKDAADIRISLMAQMLVASALLELPNESWSPRFEDPRVTHAVESIAAVYPERIDNTRLAQEAHMHPTAFLRLFRQCTGHTPLRHLLNLRLEEACNMLHFDDASLDEIAEKTGFADRGYFTRIFSREMNCPPAKYRKLVNVSNRLRPDG